jgi:hypothetical protein
MIIRQLINFFCYNTNNKGDCKLAKPNYQFKKRQKELARKRKKELKRRRKTDKKTDESEIQQDQTQKTIEPPETT